jgi:hypothetical protein
MMRSAEFANRFVLGKESVFEVLISVNPPLRSGEERRLRVDLVR